MYTLACVCGVPVFRAGIPDFICILASSDAPGLDELHRAVTEDACNGCAVPDLQAIKHRLNSKPSSRRLPCFLLQASNPRQPKRRVMSTTSITCR